MRLYIHACAQFSQTLADEEGDAGKLPDSDIVDVPAKLQTRSAGCLRTYLIENMCLTQVQPKHAHQVLVLSSMPQALPAAMHVSSVLSSMLSCMPCWSPAD